MRCHQWRKATTLEKLKVKQIRKGSQQKVNYKKAEKNSDMHTNSRILSSTIYSQPSLAVSVFSDAQIIQISGHEKLVQGVLNAGIEKIVKNHFIDKANLPILNIPTDDTPDRSYRMLSLSLTDEEEFANLTRKSLPSARNLIWKMFQAENMKQDRGKFCHIITLSKFYLPTLKFYNLRLMWIQRLIFLW